MAGLDKVAAFRALSERGKALLNQGVTTHRFKGGNVIIDKGQDVSGAYFVLEGRLRVFTYTPAGREATLYLIEPGETCILALNSLFNRLLYPAWVQTEKATTVAVVPGPVYRGLFESEPSVQGLTVEALSTLVFRLMAELEQVHSHRLDQRLASFLLVHAQEGGTLQRTQQEIAGHIGTTREMVARLLGRMAKQGWIETSRGAVRIVKRTALAAIIKS
ncbi:cAMP-binding protein-catabolite gene activator and regulatory subunit of cAMP-dependent protein kinase [Rhodospirillaceae bacterium LM-1]|nr:cAMP-binding protein-catabolite gene activator and regulatory subunit of cAMP-dependent protein kinase [Rhodospirillaceae bacterium LM-1]